MATNTREVVVMAVAIPSGIPLTDTVIKVEKVPERSIATTCGGELTVTKAAEPSGENDNPSGIPPMLIGMLVELMGMEEVSEKYSIVPEIGFPMRTAPVGETPRTVGVKLSDPCVSWVNVVEENLRRPLGFVVTI